MYIKFVVLILCGKQNEGNVIDIENITIKENVLEANFFDYISYGA